MRHTAVALLVLLGIAHSFLGEHYILMRLFRQHGLPKLFGSARFTAGTLRFVWHLLTIAWLGIAAVIVQASGRSIESTAVLQVFSGVALVSGLMALLFTRAKHLSWVVFFAVAVLLWLASSRR